MPISNSPFPVRLALSVAVCAVSVALGAAPPGIASAWISQPIVVDGMSNEWPKLDTLDRGLMIGAANDADSLNLVLSTNDQQLRGLLAAGLIIWMDTAGGKAQTFGVRIPGAAPPLLPGMTPAAPPSSDAASEGITTKVNDRFDLLGPGKNQRRLIDVTPELGVEMASGLQENAVIYEIRLPLKKTDAHPYAVNAGPGATIGLGIATPEAPRGPNNRGPLVGSAGNIGGDPYHGGGFAPFREKEERVKPLEIWTTLKLATK